MENSRTRRFARTAILVLAGAAVGARLLSVNLLADLRVILILLCCVAAWQRRGWVRWVLAYFAIGHLMIALQLAPLVAVLRLPAQLLMWGSIVYVAGAVALFTPWAKPYFVRPLAPKDRPNRQQFLFVYGTLREGLAQPMTDLIRRYARPAGRAWLRGKLFDLGDYPGAVLSQDDSDRIAGELYRIEPGQEAILFAELDRYEDCDPDDASASEYVRVRAQVQPEEGGPLEAWVYQYNRPTDRLERIVSGDYCAHLRAGGKNP